MSLVVKGGGDFEPAPKGSHPSICIDVVDLGTVDTPHGARSRLRIVWAIDKKMKNGKPYIAQRTYGRSLHSKSSLRKDLETWRGRPFTERDLAAGFDLEKLLGVAAYLTIQHKPRSEGGVFANIVSVLPLPKGQPAPIPDPEYVRVKDRLDGKPMKHGHPEGEDYPESEEPREDAPWPDDDDAPSEENDDDSIPF